MSIEVTVRDLETNEVDTTVVGDGDYLLIATEPAYLHYANHYSNGTAVVTVKGCTFDRSRVVTDREALAKAADAGRQMAAAAESEPETLPALHSYWCNTCWSYTVTIQLDEGQVPDKVACRAQGFAVCPGNAHLHKQRREVALEPKWEWVAATHRSVSSDENAAVALAARSALILQPFGTRRGDVL